MPFCYNKTMKKMNHTDILLSIQWSAPEFHRLYPWCCRSGGLSPSVHKWSWEQQNVCLFFCCFIRAPNLVELCSTHFLVCHWVAYYRFQSETITRRVWMNTFLHLYQRDRKKTVVFLNSNYPFIVLSAISFFHSPFHTHPHKHFN